MKTTDRQPILETLSHAEKDELILRLWDDLCEARARLAGLEARLANTEAADGPSPLRAELQKHSTEERPAAAPAPSVTPRLGRGVLRSRFLLGAAAFVALAFALDAA